MASEKRSFAHLSAKFNTEAPAGYVPGQGRGCVRALTLHA